MDLDLTGQLLAGLSAGQVGLRDDLESPSGCFVLLSFNRLNPLHLVAFREATLSKEATTTVSYNLTGLVVILRVDRFDFLFNRLQQTGRQQKRS